MALSGIKGITIEFRAETKAVSTALRKVDGETRNVDKALRQVNSALKFNPKNTELMAQKQTLLKQKVEQTKERLKILNQTQKQMDASKVDKTSREYMELRREIIITESKLKTFNTQLRQTSAMKFTAVGNSMKNLGSNIASVGAKMTVTGGIMVMAGKKLLESTQVQSDAENKLVEIYKTRMGVGKQAAQSTMEVASALQKEGVIGDEVTLSGAQMLATYSKMPGTVNALLPAMNNLLVQQKGLNATSDDATNIAKMMGKVMQGQTGALTKAGVTFDEAQAKVLKYGTEEERAAMLAEVITENVGNMNSEFAKTDAGKIQQAKNTLGDLGEQLGATLLPALANFANMISTTVLPKLQEFINFLSEHEAISSFIVALTGIMVIGGPLVTIIGGIISAIGSLIGIVGTISAALEVAGIVGFGGFIAAAGPVIAIVAAVAAAIFVVIKVVRNWGKITAAAARTVTSAVNKIKAVFRSVSSVAGTVGAAFRRIATAMTRPITSAQAKLRGIINKVKGFFPIKVGNILSGIKLPHFTISGSFSIKNKTVPKLGISWYKDGGMFDGPSVIGVGEAGREAVLPLNRKSLTPLAEMLNDLQGGGTGGATFNITMNVSGADNPEDWANRFVSGLKRQARMGV